MSPRPVSPAAHAGAFIPASRGIVRCGYFVTVKSEVLVPVPPGVVTEIGPLLAVFGTVASISVSETTVNCLALTPLNITRVAPVKWLPVIATTVPRGPLVGEKPLITGAVMTVKLSALVAVPPGVVTEMGPLVAPCGTTAMICVPLIWNVALEPLNCTLVALARFVPWIVTFVPAPPLAGVKLVIVGEDDTVTVKFVELVAVPPGVVTEIGPVVAADGTVAMICVSELVKVALVPLNFTADAAVKFIPAIVTEVPTGPLVGVKPLIVGGGGLTVVIRVSELFEGFGSDSLAETLAVLESVVATVGVTTIVTVAVAPLSSEPRAHVTVLVPAQLPCDEEEDTNVTLTGSASLVVTLVAVLGPLLLTVSVYVREFPTVTGFGDAALVIDRSAAVGL